MTKKAELTAPVRSEAINFSPEDVETIKNSIMPEGSTVSDLNLFLAHCKRTRLDPFSRQAYCFKQAAKVVNGITIDGARVIAERSEKYAGQAQPMWCGPDKVWVDVWLDKQPPAAAKVGVWRSDFKEPMIAVATFEGYKQQYFDRQSNTWKLSGQWAKNPSNQLAKCAEMLALRKAFPNDLSGIYSKEEEGAFTERGEVITVGASDTAFEEAVQKAEDIGHGMKGVRVATVELGGEEEIPFDTGTEPSELTKKETPTSTSMENGTVQSTASKVISPPINDDLITTNDLAQLLIIGTANGYVRQEISDYLLREYQVTSENILQTLTKEQMTQTMESFSKKKE